MENTENNTVELSSHEQAMINKIDGHNDKVDTSFSSDEEVQNKYAGKFNSTEDLEKAYIELQKKLGHLNQNKGAIDSENSEDFNEDGDPDVSTLNEKAQETSTEDAKNLVEGKGFDFEALTKEYQTNGDLSQETYDSLSKAGIPKEMVDTYVQGQQAILQAKVQEIYNTIGGETEYQEMISWAVDNLSDTDKNAFNNAISLNDDVAKFVVQSLYSRYKSNTPGKLINTNGKSTTNGGYATKSEMMRDMNSVDYKRDPEFRAIVQAKIARSKW